MMRSCRKTDGFTLVELLVVISIIALLLSILLPSLQRAKAEAYELLCQNTLRNFSLAHKMYLTEFGTYMPHTNYDPYSPWFNNNYFRQAIGLSTLTREERTRRKLGVTSWIPNAPRKFICPAATFALKNGEDGLYPFEHCYGVNIDGDYRARVKGISNVADKEGWVKRPSQKLFMADAMDWWTSYYWCEGYDKYGEDYIPGETAGMAAFRHYDRLNLMYWDGHCGQLPREEVEGNKSLWDPLY